jgi:hypothetical protein
LGVESECIDAEQRKPGRKRKTGGDDDTAADASSPPPPSPLATPSTPQFVQPPPRPPLLQSSGSLPRIIDMAELGSLFAGPPTAQSFDRKHPLYITPDTLPNPERPFNTFVNTALSVAARAGEQFAQAISHGPDSHSSEDTGTISFDLVSVCCVFNARPFRSACVLSVAAAAAEKARLEVLSESVEPPISSSAAAVRRPLIPSTVMQSAYFVLYECLLSLRRQLEAGRAPMHTPLLRFLWFARSVCLFFAFTCRNLTMMI